MFEILNASQLVASPLPIAPPPPPGIRHQRGGGEPIYRLHLSPSWQVLYIYILKKEAFPLSTVQYCIYRKKGLSAI